MACRSAGKLSGLTPITHSLPLQDSFENFVFGGWGQKKIASPLVATRQSLGRVIL
jgi:hypothetical protein